MNYFGEYLVEKKIVSEEKLIVAILQQIKEQPCPAKIAIDENLITAKDLIHLFKIQYEQQLDFFTAATLKKFLTSEQVKIIKEKIQGLQIPLPTILLRNGDIEVKNLVHALDEYLSSTKIIDNSI